MPLAAVGEVVWQLEPDVLGLQLRCLDASNDLGSNDLGSKPIAKGLRWMLQREALGRRISSAQGWQKSTPAG